ncbi:MAG: YgiQ family radical SAM protein, partial [Methanoregulaceae archaeon]|nr:YgiQ family radical SAM protein [Methanoregulaceae archaeon]
MIPQPRFLPMSLEEAKKIGIGSFDVILVTGDAYVDHPSFGTALIGRVLWEEGYTVGVIAQPDWKNEHDFRKLGTPRLFFGVSSGNVDSMVNHFTANRKRRREDVYSPGGRPGRPDRATIVYTNRLHAIFPGIPVVMGGIEASLRRFAHFDYWSGKVRQSILADAPADLLAFGMAETQMCTIADRLRQGEPVRDLTEIAGTAFRMSLEEWRSTGHEKSVEIPGFPEVSKDPSEYARAFALHYREQDPVRGRLIAQPHPKAVIIQNPPAQPLTTGRIDRIYELPFSRSPHPSYREPIPALGPVRFSITSHRGCFGGCSFCALTHHQGRIVQ